jgi:hypothetical protein
MKWFTNITILNFYVGPVEVRLELERKATYLGLWWQRKRRKVHVYVAFLAMVQIHLVFPPRSPSPVVDATTGQAELEGGAEPPGALDPPEQAADVQGPQGDQEGGADVPGAQAASSP